MTDSCVLMFMVESEQVFEQYSEVIRIIPKTISDCQRSMFIDHHMFFNVNFKTKALNMHVCL